MTSDKRSTAVPKLRFPEFADMLGWLPTALSDVLDYEQPGDYIVDDTNYQDTGTPVLTANKSFVLGCTAETDGIYENVPVIIFDDFTTDAKYVDFPFKVKSSAIKILTSRSDDELKLVYELMRRTRFDPTQHKRYYISQYQHLKIPLPDKVEQKKITDCLGSLDGLIAAEGRKLEALRQHKQGLMQQLFPQPGETQPRLGRRIDWEPFDLPDRVFFQEGPGIMAVDFRDDGVPLVRLSGLSEPTVTLDGCNYLSPEKVAAKWEHFRLVEGDLLVSASASFGRPAIVTEVAAGAVFYTGLIRFRPLDDCLSAGFLRAYLDSPSFMRQAMAFAVGGGIKHFGPSHLRQMQIQVPPDEEQERIAGLCSSIDEVLVNQSRRLDALINHKQGLLQQLFPSLEER